MDGACSNIQICIIPPGGVRLWFSGFFVGFSGFERRDHNLIKYFLN